MAYLFGILDLPTFELVFILTIINMVGLLFILISLSFIYKELRSFRQLFRQEKTDILEFEADLKKLEKFESKDHKDLSELVDFVSDNLKKGYSWEVIKQNLLAQGWDQTTLDSAYKEAKQ